MAGWPNGAGTPRGTAQRVIYRIEEDKLIREHWNVMDATLATPPVKRELLDRGRARRHPLPDLRPRMDRGVAPVRQYRRLGFYTRPLAVEITIVLADFGELRRLIEVPG